VAKKIKLTRPELKRYREALARYERYLPMLKLKQQRLQVMLRDVARQRREAEASRNEVEAALNRYRSVMADRAGVPLHDWSEPSEVKVNHKNVAGVPVPIFQSVQFPEVRYSLFGTPPWVDQALADLRERSRRQAIVEVLQRQEEVLRGELTRIIQRVNLFEKIMIPDAREAIRRIRIKLGDEMTDAVGRSKIAKNKLSQTLENDPGDANSVDNHYEGQVNGEHEQESGPGEGEPTEGSQQGEEQRP
jgi:V/A-type H+-transporting ATPase subunit D